VYSPLPSRFAIPVAMREVLLSTLLPDYPPGVAATAAGGNTPSAASRLPMTC